MTDLNSPQPLFQELADVFDAVLAVHQERELKLNQMTRERDEAISRAGRANVSSRASVEQEYKQDLDRIGTERDSSLQAAQAIRDGNQQTVKANVDAISANASKGLAAIERVVAGALFSPPKPPPAVPGVFPLTGLTKARVDSQRLLAAIENGTGELELVRINREKWNIRFRMTVIVLLVLVSVAIGAVFMLTHPQLLNLNR